MLTPEAADEAGWGARRSERMAQLVSARSGEGIAELLAAIDNRLGGQDEILTLTLPPQAGALLAWLHGNTQVLSRKTADNGDTLCRVRIERAKTGRLLSRLRSEGLEQPRVG